MTIYYAVEKKIEIPNGLSDIEIDIYIQNNVIKNNEKYVWNKEQGSTLMSHDNYTFIENYR